MISLSLIDGYIEQVKKDMRPEGYLWKENKADAEYKETWGNPRLTKEGKIER